MRNAKSRGGLTGGRMRSCSSRIVWLLTLHHFSIINGILTSCMKKPETKHPDYVPNTLKADHSSFLKVFSWMISADLKSAEPDKLISFSSGLMSSDGIVNACDSEGVGLMILSSLDGGNFTDKFPNKLKCKNFDALRKTVKINKRETVLQPLMLFTRLALVSQRQLTLKQSLCFELTPLPMSLFDDKQFLRKPDKSKLGLLLKSKVEPSEEFTAKLLIVDGGWLLYQKPWEKDMTFSSIADGYRKFVISRSKSGQAIVVVFDGYENSPKDHEHRRRQGTSAGCAEILIQPDKPCPVSREKFLSNAKNKVKFINFLSSILKDSGISTAIPWW